MRWTCFRDSLQLRLSSLCICCAITHRIRCSTGDMCTCNPAFHIRLLSFIFACGRISESVGKVRPENAIDHNRHHCQFRVCGYPFLTMDDLSSTLLSTIAATRLGPVQIRRSTRLSSAFNPRRTDQNLPQIFRGCKQRKMGRRVLVIYAAEKRLGAVNLVERGIGECRLG